MKRIAASSLFLLLILGLAIGCAGLKGRGGGEEKKGGAGGVGGAGEKKEEKKKAEGGKEQGKKQKEAKVKKEEKVADAAPITEEERVRREIDQEVFIRGVVPVGEAGANGGVVPFNQGTSHDAKAQLITPGSKPDFTLRNDGGQVAAASAATKARTPASASNAAHGDLNGLAALTSKRPVAR